MKFSNQTYKIFCYHKGYYGHYNIEGYKLISKTILRVLNDQY